MVSPDRQSPTTFDWREENEARHVEKHGIPFGIASAIFLDENRLEFVDERKDYGERRWNLIGVVDGLCLHMTFTMIGSTAWIISVRPAHRKERKAYGFGP